MDEREVMNVFNKPYKPNDTLLIVLDGDIHTNILFEIKSINIEKNELELTSEYQELKLKIEFFLLMIYQDTAALDHLVFFLHI